MATASSIQTRAALKRAAAWGTPLECGAGDGLLVLPHSIKRIRRALQDDSLGAAFSSSLDYAETKVEGALPMYMRYEGVELPLALALGQTGGLPVQQGGTIAYKQSISPADDIDGLFATLALHNGVNVDEYGSLKIAGFTIKGQTGRPVEVSFECIARERTVDSTVNTTASFALVDTPEGGGRLLMSQAAFRMNDMQGAALGAGDIIRPSSFELSFRRPMSGAYTGGTGADLIDEPLATAMAEAALKLEFPRYSHKGYFEQWETGTLKKMDITFTGPLIEGAYYRSLAISLPWLAFTGVDLPQEHGVLRHPLSFACLKAASAPSGMDGIMGPVAVDIVNTNQADVLA